MRFEAASHVRDSADADRELIRLKALVSSSALPGATKTGLERQIESALEVSRRQLAVPGRAIHTRRVIEGEGYRIVIQVGPSSRGLMARLAQLLGR